MSELLPEKCRKCSQEPDLSNTLEVALRKLSSDIEHLSETLERAFPDGDIEGHRRYHEAIIEDLETRKRLVQAIKEKTISGLVWAMIVGVSLALFHEIQRIIK